MKNIFLFCLLMLPTNARCMIYDATPLIRCFEDYYGPSSQWKNEKVFESQVKTLLDQGANPNVQGFLGRTPLHQAESVSVIQRLLQAGAFVNARDDSEGTPLFNEKLSPEAVQLLLDNGASATVQSEGGYTPLHCAGSPEVVKKLVGKGADVNAQAEGGYTPLMSIVNRSAPQPIIIYDIAKALVELGADVQRADFEESVLEDVLRNFNCNFILDTQPSCSITGWAHGMDHLVPYYKIVQLLIYAGAWVTKEELQMLVYVPDFDDRRGKYDKAFTLNNKDYLASCAAQQRAQCSFKNNKVLALLLSHCDEQVFNEFKEGYLIKRETEKDPEIEALLKQPELLEDAKKEYEKFVFEEFGSK